MYSGNWEKNPASNTVILVIYVNTHYNYNAQLCKYILFKRRTISKLKPLPLLLRFYSPTNIELKWKIVLKSIKIDNGIPLGYSNSFIYLLEN